MSISSDTIGSPQKHFGKYIDKTEQEQSSSNCSFSPLSLLVQSMTRQKEQQATEKGHYNTGTPTWSYLFSYDNLEVWPHGLQYKNWKTISLFNPLSSSHCLPPIIPIGPFVPGHFANICCLALVEPSGHKERKKCPKQAHCRLLFPMQNDSFWPCADEVKDFEVFSPDVKVLRSPGMCRFE